jgi:3-dehydroquinate synthase class II
MSMTAIPIADVVRVFASRHVELVQGINELDYAKPALEQCSAYLKDLQVQVKQSDADLQRLAKSTEKERAEHIELKKSITRKWSSKLVGRAEKYEQKVTKEEK